MEPLSGAEIIDTAEATQHQHSKCEHDQKAWRGRGGGAAKVCDPLSRSTMYQ